MSISNSTGEKTPWWLSDGTYKRYLQAEFNTASAAALFVPYQQDPARELVERQANAYLRQQLLQNQLGNQQPASAPNGSGWDWYPSAGLQNQSAQLELYERELRRRITEQLSAPPPFTPGATWPGETQAQPERAPEPVFVDRFSGLDFVDDGATVACPAPRVVDIEIDL